MVPKLFLLKPSFADPKVGDGEYFCPHSATVEGLLAYYPHLRERIDIRYVDFQRPRHAVIDEIGEEHQACPVLVLPDGWPPSGTDARHSNGRAFHVGASEIATFLASWAGTGMPHP